MQAMDAQLKDEIARLHSKHDAASEAQARRLEDGRCGSASRLRSSVPGQAPWGKLLFVMILMRFLGICKPLRFLGSCNIR